MLEDNVETCVKKDINFNNDMNLVQLLNWWRRQQSNDSYNEQWGKTSKTNHSNLPHNV